MTRKELISNYKNTKFRMGVFQVRNTSNNKIFVSSSTHLEAMFNRYKAQLNFGGHKNLELQSDWNNLGEQNFVFEILSEIQHDEENQNDAAKEVKLLEQMFIDELQPFEDKGYNKKILSKHKK